ncbi:S-methyl-5-thioribose kinase [Acetobacter oeni]|uniref:S-methyl-5-thioribose kinase n=1 Tax=Acetobacter oeni TaxID=304077 RepID=A0A511XM26_9PROT|nr:S-methyl-5-thioribose kinase [Acetobacter oeni]MBB3884010.1 5-methylthioribose kinase [Acetobacter oeni]NHO20068.1 S-methyl-5-thioribose kinase [Acetobacter oeni]GBR03765.1 methylthioribose kinase [Acetobacter oeni LMG 21952]GEN63999.1 methylthioribose kinase [Acetobacter oeni]
MVRHYETLTVESVRVFLEQHDTLVNRLGSRSETWTVREVSDGNLNLVFLVQGPEGSVCVKQSLPHVRVDPQWRMPLDRTAFEAEWLRRVELTAPGCVPVFLLFDPVMFVLVMECLEGFVTFRQALGEGADAVGPSRMIGGFVARTAFFSSLPGRTLEEIMPNVSFFANNTTLMRITFDLVLSDPFYSHHRNHWLKELDQEVAVLQSDEAIARAMIRLQQRFLTCPQALLHGDLHSGSVMVRNGDVRVIDGEFSLYGPIGFDCGLYLANLVLAWAAARSGGRRAHLAEAMDVFWSGFRKDFLSLWQTHASGGDLFSEVTFSVYPSLLEAERERYIDGIFHDMTEFAAAEIVRRLIGYAQVADFDWLTGTVERADRQREALVFAGHLLREAPGSMAEFVGRLTG